jgi:hypothetical protein
VLPAAPLARLVSSVIRSEDVRQVARPSDAGPVGAADPLVPSDWEPLGLPDGEPAALPLVLEWQPVASAVTAARRTSVRLVRIDTRSPDRLELITQCNHGVFGDMVPAGARENSSYERHS